MAGPPLSRPHGSFRDYDSGSAFGGDELAAGRPSLTSTASESSLLYRRADALDTLLDRMRADQETWVFDMSVIVVVAIAGVFLLATLLMLLGLVYLFRRRDDLFQWRAFGSRRFADSDLFSSATDNDERGSLCDGMSERHELAAAAALAPTAASVAANVAAAAAACSSSAAAAMRRDRYSPAPTMIAPSCPTATVAALTRPPPPPRPLHAMTRTGVHATRTPRGKAPTRSKTAWAIGRCVSGTSESLLPLIGGSRSRSYEVLHDAEEVAGV